MPTVELLYFPGCPHVEAARAQLRRAFAQRGEEASWTERDVSAPDAAPHLRGYASPTILVDGRDVLGVMPGDATGCRVYLGSDTPGAPPLVAVVGALGGAGTKG